jgi:hypothetical protein
MSTGRVTSSEQPTLLAVSVTEGVTELRDFFISYTGSNEDWAAWIAWELEKVGYSTFLRAWDFTPGAHFVAEMHRATSGAARTIAVLSENYLQSQFASAEWQEAWRDDPSGAQKKLLVFRVEDCDRPGLLGQVVSVDLFGIDEEIARSHLLNAVRSERRKPPLPPGFPGTEPPTMPPPFPGRLIPASHHRLLVAHEELQQPELTRCQRDLRPAALHPVPTWIQGARASGSGS